MENIIRYLRGRANRIIGITNPHLLLHPTIDNYLLEHCITWPALIEEYNRRQVKTQMGIQDDVSPSLNNQTNGADKLSEEYSKKLNEVWMRMYMNEKAITQLSKELAGTNVNLLSVLDELDKYESGQKTKTKKRSLSSRKGNTTKKK